jgi:TonB family protein
MTAIVRGGGPLAQQARNYVDSLIPDAKRDLRASAGKAADASKAADEDREFNDAERKFSEAVAGKNSDGLRTVRGEFDKIGKSQSRHAGKAREYVTNRIPSALSALKPCPEIRGVGASAGGIQATPQAGAVVAVGLLDAGFSWKACVWPEVSATVMVTATVDENGNVIDVKPRGPRAAQFDAAAAAVKQWKASAPTSKGVKVKTDVGLDIKP